MGTLGINNVACHGPGLPETSVGNACAGLCISSLCNQGSPASGCKWRQKGPLTSQHLHAINCGVVSGPCDSHVGVLPCYRAAVRPHCPSLARPLPAGTPQSLEKCDFTPIYDWAVEQREKKKSISKEACTCVTSPRMGCSDSACGAMVRTHARQGNARHFVRWCSKWCACCSDALATRPCLHAMLPLAAPQAPL
jgi:hypothetical protein